MFLVNIANPWALLIALFVTVCFIYIGKEGKNAKVDSNKKYDYDKDTQIKDKIEELEKEFSGNGRVLIRPSGTEPLVRVMIEGEDKEYIKTKEEELALLIQEKLR